jgi:hypothetical protein
MMRPTRNAIQKHLDETYGEGMTRLLGEPSYSYGEWFALVVFGSDGPLVRMVLGTKPKQLELKYIHEDL